MFNYRLVDIKGKTLGVVSLENEDIPKMMLDGGQFELSVGCKDRQVNEFVIVPKALAERTQA